MALRAENHSPGPTYPKAILESPSEQFLAIFYLQVSLILPIKCSVQKKTVKIDFQDGFCDGHRGFPIWTILANFDLQATTIPFTKFTVSWTFGSGVEVQNRFSRWRPWQPKLISDRNKVSYFLSTSHPLWQPTLISDRNHVSYFSRWQPWQPTSIFDRNHFSYFWSTSHPNTSYQVLSQLHFGSGEEVQNRCHGRHLEFPICSILAMFNLTVTSGLWMKVSNQLAFQLRRRVTKYIFKIVSVAAILDFLLEPLRYFLSYYKLPWYFLPSFEPVGHSIQEKSSKYIFKIGMTMFQVCWHFHSGEEVQNRFSRGGHLGFWIRTILAILYQQVAKSLLTKFQVNWPFGSG